jgi:hypothetical protein
MDVYQPRWRRDGRELFFLTPGKTLMTAPIPTTPDRAGVPAALFRTDPVALLATLRLCSILRWAAFSHQPRWEKHDRKF